MGKRKRIPITTTTAFFPSPQEPPSIPGFTNTGFQTSSTYAAFRETAEQKRKEEEKKRQAELARQRKEKIEDESIYSIKVICDDNIDSDDDDDFPRIATNSANFEPSKKRQPRSSSIERVNYKGGTTSTQAIKLSPDSFKYENKKRRRQYSSSSSSSSSSSEIDSYHRRTKRDRHYTSSNNKRAFQEKKVEEWGLIDVERYKRFTNIASLILSDIEPDYTNVEYGSLNQIFIPTYNLFVRAIIDGSEQLNFKLFNYAAFSETSRFTRFFDKSIVEKWGEHAVERRFRKKCDINSGFLPLSHVPYNEDDDEGAVKNEQLHNMNLEEFQLYQMAQSVSFEDYNIPVEMKAQILTAKITREPQTGVEKKIGITDFATLLVKQNPYNIEDWLELVRLQDFFSNDFDFAIWDEKEKIKKANERKLKILRTAVQKNFSNVPLRLETIKVMMHLYGENSLEVVKEWESLEHRQLDSMEMWKGYIMVHLYDRKFFNLEEILALIDRCLNKINVLVSGNCSKEKGTEEFLANLILLRCKLLLETGNLPKVIAGLQALTELNLFAPDMNNLGAKISFEKFWDSGVCRIGDENAMGWTKSPVFDSSTKTAKLNESNKQLEFDGDYGGFLGAQLKRLEENENQLLEKCRAEGLSHPQVWSVVEKCREKFTWRPLRHVHDKLREDYSWCKPDFSRDIKPIVIKFSNEKIMEKIICILLKHLGCVIPGKFANTVEDILNEFGALPSNLSRQYDGMYEFLDRFLELLSRAESTSVEFRARFIVARLLTFQKQAQENFQNNIQAKKAIQKFTKELLISKYTDVNLQSLISYYAAESLNPFDSNSAKETYEKLLKFGNENIWKMANEIRRLAYLKAAVDLCRIYPYYQVDESGIASKRVFLNILGAFGYYKECKQNDIDKDSVKLFWIERIKSLKGIQPNSNLAWLGDEFALTLELAALYFYESKSTPSKKIQDFENLLKAVEDSNGKKESIMDLRIRVDFGHITSKKKGDITYRNDGFRLYKDMVNEAIELYPENIRFLKAYIDLGNYQSARVFLRKEYKDTTIKLIRLCGLYYLEKCVQEKLANSTNVSHLRNTLEYIARKNCESLIPDCTLWRILLAFEQKYGNTKKIDEVFTLALSNCPWSKNSKRSQLYTDIQSQK